MTVHDEDQPGDAVPRGRRARIVVGAVTGLAVLGVGSYLLTSHLTATGDVDAVGTVSAPTSDVPTAAAQAVDPTSAPASSVPASSAPASSPVPKVSTAPMSSADAAKLRREIKKAREQDEKNSQKPVSAKGMNAPELATRTEPTADGTIRITTAKGDLTGGPDLRLAADEGKLVGTARCTKRVAFANRVKAREIPTLLLCWRTSADRSVVTLAVSRKDKPAAEDSLEIIDREWAKLG
ncbi:hypothetical protein ACIA5D_20825 [Actinoplanes sp. NPDC051513]|uniref:hypothetical protein n=1 Tax=Actinoplanes sp. NPDC051513 TaxID=3363908 RepID=UPI00378D6CC2